jgi:hypothetical protein
VEDEEEEGGKRRTGDDDGTRSERCSLREVGDDPGDQTKTPLASIMSRLASLRRDEIREKAPD